MKIVRSLLKFIWFWCRGFENASFLSNGTHRNRNNGLLDEGIEAYQEVVDSEETPKALFILAAKRLVNRLQFRGKMGSAIKVA